MPSRDLAGKGGWNYRIFKRELDDGLGGKEVEFYVGEAYYDDKTGKLNGWTEGPTTPIGNDKWELFDALAAYSSAMSQAYIDLTVDPPVEVGPKAKTKKAKS